MRRRDPIQGDLQEQVMRILWEIEGGSVEDVREAMPRSRRGAYTTVQTVLNRLANRGLLKRTKRGKALVYTPRISEAQYVAGSLDRTLAAASREARLIALASLVGGLDAAERSEIDAMAQEIDGRRQ